MIKNFSTEYIWASDAGKLSGVTRDAIYKAIKAKKLPAIVEIVMGKPRVKIPTAIFLVWMEKEIERFEGKITHLRKSHKKLKEFVYG